MNRLVEFWNSMYPSDKPLEVNSRLARAANRFVVAGLLNAFPKATTKILALSRGEFARLLIFEKEGGSYRTFRAMYDYEDPAKRGDPINRILMQSPGVKAARNRRKIAQRMLQRFLEDHPPGKPALVMVLGGGDGRLESEVLARLPRRDLYYCMVDKDDRVVEENRKTMQEFGIEGRGAVFLGNIAEKDDLLAVVENARARFGVPFEGADAAVCHGIAEYMDVGSRSNVALSKMLSAIHACMKPEGRLFISQTDYHDRVHWVERGLGWYMRLRDIDELAGEVENAGWQIAICEHEPMRLISMCMAVKTDQPHPRIDAPSFLEYPRAKRRFRARAVSS